MVAKRLCLVAVLSLVLGGGPAVAGWELYDNFNSGIIDPLRWAVDDSSATITVVGGKARFEHHAGFPADSAWLKFLVSPETIKAVAVTVDVAACSDDARARIGGWVGQTTAGDHIWNELATQAGTERLWGALWECEGPGCIGGHELAYTEFEHPIPVVGNSFLIATTFTSPTSATYFVRELGTHTVAAKKTALPPGDLFRSIGTRSDSGNGACDVTFDDVLVLR